MQSSKKQPDPSKEYARQMWVSCIAMPCVFDILMSTFYYYSYVELSLSHHTLFYETLPT